MTKCSVNNCRNNSICKLKKCGVSHFRSIPIPDGLVMDPLSPTALAVPNQIMGRIGNGLTLLRDHGKKVQKYLRKNRKFEVLKKSWKSTVNIILVEAKDLPDCANTNSNGLYCKFRLGNESHKSKQVHKSKATWRERFNIHLYEDNLLEVKVLHKNKQKVFMGRCVIDLAHLEMERTHDLWQELECGYGSLHLLITILGSGRPPPTDNIPTTNGFITDTTADEKYLWYNLMDSWDEVGQLSVTVHGAKGLSALNLRGNVSAYCMLELDNSRVKTHVVRGTPEPNWNKSFTFAVNDITSAIDITVYEESMIHSMKGEMLGKVSIPLLRINNNEMKWYALKDRNKKKEARGDCPRILLEMAVVWNPLKATMRVLRPKEVKYVQKPPKFDIPLILYNLRFIKGIFKAFQAGNECFKRVFEWDNQEKSVLALGAWLTFWYFFRMWMTPLLLLIPFIHYWLIQRNSNTLVTLIQTDDDCSDEETDAPKDEKTIKNRINELQDFTITIKNGIDYIVSLIERLHNLTKFSVPYLSYLVMLVLVVLAVAFYLIPANYFFMAFGVYKFTRKFLNPNRVPNNDILDFVSRVPDNALLKQWRELKVPESGLDRSDSSKTR
ncbi:multiple C2 and transmembrane domain-containing protein-like isoform X2 [Leptidea sinapis]|uniref:multiple C2 and transmembrane domain-containing protein-like isoform X2 n=1 Tax=Leptidea sinapis TaxID=189913 RepID=UPI002131F2D6|nr:multiple C2 and transmembrane domain-containing protein-like isoform X2 [Leptidea sinapis]